MAIQFSFKETPQYLLVEASGRDESLQEVQRYGMAVLAQVQSSGASRVFCDERHLIYELSLANTYQLAESASEVLRTASRIGIVCNEQGLETGKFYEVSASNRGLEVFISSSYQEVKDWLLRDMDSA